MPRPLHLRPLEWEVWPLPLLLQARYAGRCIMTYNTILPPFLQMTNSPQLGHYPMVIACTAHTCPISHCVIPLLPQNPAPPPPPGPGSVYSAPAPPPPPMSNIPGAPPPPVLPVAGAAPSYPTSAPIPKPVVEDSRSALLSAIEMGQ